MSFSKNENKNTRIISIFFIYILFLQELTSFAFSCNSLNKSISNFEKTNFLVSTEKNQEIKEIESISKPKNFKNISKVFSGPGQSENTGFSVGSTDGMVDKFTGDFSYSIPLMDVEGYPISIKYNSNVAVNTDASWVGLGWDLSTGSISREMRGIPDEFNGNQNITRTFNEKKDETTGGYKIGAFIGGGPYIKKVFLPTIQATALWGGYHNSYLGTGTTFDFGLQSQFSLSMNDYKQSIGIDFGYGYSKDNKNGIGISKSFGISAETSSKSDGLGASAKGSATFGNSYNSRRGLMTKSFSWEAKGGYLSQEKDNPPKGVNASAGMGSTIMYGTQTSVPRVAINAKGSSWSSSYRGFVGVKGGKGVLMGGVTGSNYNNVNEPTGEGNVIIQPAFGYFHSGKRAGFKESGKYPIMDFNRTSESEYSETMKDLSFSIQTYDIFYANAMGISTTFRGRRNDFGSYYDPSASIKINGKEPVNDIKSLLKNVGDADMMDVSAGFIFAKGANKINVGLAVGYMPGTTESGPLLLSGGGNVLEFTQQAQSNVFDNTLFFKSIGEATPEAMGAYTALNGGQPDYFKLQKSGNNAIVLTNTLKNKEEDVSSSSLNNINPTELGRDNGAIYYNVKIASDFPVNSTYGSFNSNDLSINSIPRIDDLNGKAANLVSAIEVVNTDGMRYNYGIPVFSVKNDEVSFAASGLSEVLDVDNIPLGLINYVSYNDNPLINDNSPANTRGWSNYYDKTETPAYAHTFLLTEMVSSDYIDRTGDGITLDDVGSGYKFNYTQKFSSSTPFKWRYPVSGGSEHQAIFSKGLLGSSLDDMAHYTYGEKEIWYSHSIESKNLIAVFKLLNREDGYSVKDENGGLDKNKQLQKLDKIILYNRADFIANGSNAKPLQTVEFEYDYSLCLNTPTNAKTYLTKNDPESGKLTLKKIRVYNGNSKELGLSVYSFEYDNKNNKSFRYCDVDGWGNFKKNDVTKPNDLYPYAIQDENIANYNINAYKLIAINNPMGGRTEIKYEADRYGFVQNKKVMSHINIEGMTDIFSLMEANNSNSWNKNMTSEFTSNIGEGSILSKLNGTSLNDLRKKILTKGGISYINTVGHFEANHVPNNVIIFKLENTIDNSKTKAEADLIVANNYFKDPSKAPNTYIDKLLFKTRVQIKPGVEELVPCFADISPFLSNVFGNVPDINFNDDILPFGVMPLISSDDNYEYGYVVLNPLNVGDIELSSSDKSGKEDLAIHPLQRMAFDYARQNLPDILYGSCDGCSSDLTIDQAVSRGENMYVFLVHNGSLVNRINLGSTIKLFDGDGIKFGGNARVSQIKYLDNWSTISGEYPSQYVWNYSYPDNARLNNITSGVAAYETRAILDENPFYSWDSYLNNKKKFPDETKFTPTPIADALFPIPIVGYSEVQVRLSGVNKGYTSSTFYTAQNYPTVYSQTNIDNTVSIKKHNLFFGRTIDIFGFSQGFSVETNDCHGKPKETKLYNSLGDVQSRTTYHYYGLGDKLPMLDRSGNLKNESVSLEYDMHTDSRFITDNTEFTELGINLCWTIPSFVPVPGPIFFQTKRESGFYSNALIKHINRSIILKSIETENMGSINNAENLVYDKYSGNVLLSCLNDEFDDKLYSLNYPSHWYYDNLRDLSGVLKTNIKGHSNLTNYTYSVTDIDAVNEFSPGDLLTVNLNDGKSIDLIVYSIVGNELSLTTKNGEFYDLFFIGDSFKIKKSNRDNRLNEIMQNIVTKINPVSTSGFKFPVNEIISASAVSYTTRKGYFCQNESNYFDNPNPFKTGKLGDLVVDRHYAWQDERIELSKNNVRFSGTYKKFSPFYFYSNGDGNCKSVLNDYFNQNLYYNDMYTFTDFNHPNWRLLNKNILFDYYANPLESIDQIGIHSSVLYGYNNLLNLLPTAQLINSAQQDAAFDGFEDYNYFSNFNLPNSESHFDFKSTISANVTLEVNERHSGLASLKISPNNSAIVNKLIGENNCEQVTSSTSSSSTSSSSSSRLSSRSAEIISSNNSPNNFIPCNCVKPFMPRPNDYIISVWVKEDNSLLKESYNSGKVNVLVDNINIGSFLPTGKIINGWQRLEGGFTIPNNNYSKISIELKNQSSNTNVYFDDFRIHPFLAGMTSVVYDPVTLLPLATHDGYNFTTFFNYDENLNQVRVKVETENGIQTISEGEFGGQKTFK